MTSHTIEKINERNDMKNWASKTLSGEKLNKRFFKNEKNKYELKRPIQSHQLQRTENFILEKSKYEAKCSKSVMISDVELD